MTARRLATGGHINRASPVRFQWDKKSMAGFQGDTLASALLANNESVVARSFKYHRPRGVMSAGVEESGAIVTIGEGSRTDANVRATTQELYSGLLAFGQNGWPNVRNDLGAISDKLGRFFAAGFYYKTFMGIPPLEWGRGTGIWMQYEKLIRRAAGMGTASREPDPDRYEHAHGFCDVLVIGSGPAGLAAAQTACAEGLDVWLVEQDFELGGNLLNESADSSKSCRLAMIDILSKQNVTIKTRTTAFGLYDNNVAGLVERVTDHHTAPSAYLPRQRFWTVRAGVTIVATGAIERSIAFGDNDRPGIMTANSARAYMNRFGVLCGENIVIATNNDSVYDTAEELARAGAKVTLMDVRQKPANTSLKDAAGAVGVDVRDKMAPVRALGTSAIHRILTAIVAGNEWRQQSGFDCDSLLVSGGWSPVVNLLSHRGVKPVWDSSQAAFVPPSGAYGLPSEHVLMAGSATGVWNLDDCIESGEAAGLNAAVALGKSVKPKVYPSVGGWLNPIEPVYEITVPGPPLKSFVDPQHDVTTEDIRLAHREGFVSVEHMKRYTTLGMATDQGKMGNIIGIALMADALGKEIPDVGTTTFRPPYTPVSLGALRGRHAGTHFRPLRRTPLHTWNTDHGATMTEAGLWQRPWYFAKNGESISQAYVREARITREKLGICDVTSLGKISVQGPDATEFLERIYANAFAKLNLGKARYGIMLRDDGMVLDDGTTWRLGETDYFMTTTTAHAGAVMVWLEELLQVRWPELRVHVTSVSEQWAGVSVAGPASRAVLSETLGSTLDMSGDAFPFMAVKSGYINDDIPCRIARISFSGELAYEIYVPSDYAPAMMDKLWEKAEPLGGCLYGLEALGALRIEKGHVTGAELDGRVTIEDAGLGKMASNKKSYIGSALRNRPELNRVDRPQLVGIFPKDRRSVFNAGSLLFCSHQTVGHGEGWITGVTHSPALGHWIGIGFIAGGHQAWTDKKVVSADPLRKGFVDVEIVSPHMFDPDGVRVHG